MELDFWVSTFTMLTMESSLLTGFSFSGLSYIEEFKGKRVILNMLYLVATSASMGSGLVTVTTCSLCLLLGPGKALRANNIDSIDETIDYLRGRSYMAFYFFVF